MSKFSHISSIEDLDKEILKTELKKRIIKDDIALRAKSVKEMLKPVTIGWQLVRMLMSNRPSKTPASMIIKIATEILTTVEASKYAVKFIKRVFR